MLLLFLFIFFRFSWYVKTIIEKMWVADGWQTGINSKNT